MVLNQHNKGGGMKTKVCTRCGLEKPVSEFTPRKNSKCGYYSACRVCYSLDYRVYAGPPVDITGLTKICTKCGLEKLLTEFPIRKSRKCGRYSMCNVCANVINKQYRGSHIDEIKIYKKEWDLLNPEYAVIHNKKYYAEHGDEQRAAAKLRYEKDPERFILAAEKWAEAHPEQRREITRRRDRKRRLDPIYRFLRSYSHGIWDCLKGQKNNVHCFEYVDYTFEELIAHIESLWTPGMSWDNYGRNGWHLDHIFPEAKLYITGPDDPTFKFLWSLKNLQPLWESDNIIKSVMYPWEWEAFKLAHPEKLYKYVAKAA